jgi:hypothetical protein
VEPPRDHEVDDEKEVVLELDHDPLPHASHALDLFPGELFWVGSDGAKQEGVSELEPFETGTADPFLEGLYVDGDVR